MKGEHKGDELNRLFVQRFKLWQKLINIKDFARGTVVILRRPCTRKSCRLCKEGKKHPAIYLSVSKKGKTHLIYLPKRIREKAREWTSNYQQLWQILDEVSDTNHELLRLWSKKETSGKDVRNAKNNK